MAVGFIRDDLEVKFLILYVAACVREPVTMTKLQELTMIDEGFDYFKFAECLNDLVQTENLRLDDDGFYQITEKGKRNNEICQSSLPYSVRLRADKEIAFFNQKSLHKERIIGRVYPRENGTYTVELSLNDTDENIMHLQIMVATEEMARDLCRRFEDNPEKIYADILSDLYG